MVVAIIDAAHTFILSGLWTGTCLSMTVGAIMGIIIDSVATVLVAFSFYLCNYQVC